MPRKGLLLDDIFIALLCLAAFWALDSAADTFFFSKSTFLEAAMTVEGNEVFERLLGGVLLALLLLALLSIRRHRRREAAYLKLSLQAKLATSAAGDGIYYVDTEGCFTFINEAAAALFGYEGPELTGKPAHQMVHQAWMYGRTHEPEECPTHRCLADKKVHTVREERLFRRDGSSFPAEYVNSPIVHEDEVLGAVVVVRDVTEQKRYEQALEKHSRELEEVSRYRQVFADVMHHDLQGPLSNVDGFAAVLQERSAGGEDGTLLERIRVNIARARTILEEATKLTLLESYSGIETEDVDLAVLLREAAVSLRDMAADARVTMELALPPSMPSSASRIISQVFDNLVSNALKYASGGGRIRVEGEDAGSRWRIRVVDFGSGIPDGEKEQLFLRFQRKEKGGVKGSGLGLAISRRICELHGTSIWIEDNPEGGAVFVFEVPKSTR